MDTEPYEFPLTLRVPRNAFVIVSPEPATVSQRTVEQHFGIPSRMYKEMVRDGLLPAKRIGRLIFASYEDVKRVVTDGAVARVRVETATRAAIIAQEKEPPMAIEAAHADLAGARTPREQRDRQKEIESKAWALMHECNTKLDDGSPNPRHDKRLYDHSMDLVVVRMGQRKKRSGPSGGGGPTAVQGGYRKCTWCERPAYATKQQWTGNHWSGAPVCEVCAKTRADNERVVSFGPDKILLPPRDPTVPTEWHAPRRRRKRT